VACLCRLARELCPCAVQVRDFGLEVVRSPYFIAGNSIGEAAPPTRDGLSAAADMMMCLLKRRMSVGW
jgi:hypothetical protein